ncbi:hypothetical protein Acr_01g0012190 [Actinidia rufa]|uniref:Retrotransposon Copia-like N-terminal domain-containing protein n=1 Tax=Actinidia rufa TaxID=165716 RepID=A0A7J0E4R3_9ERIC|nr:hypothetical protein Acr_01g0012190 [Actinidia rufa]
MDDNAETQPPQQQSSALQPAPARRITSVPLSSTNFASWSRSVRLYLGARGKLCWLSGDVAKPDGKDASKLEQWEMDNYRVVIQFDGSTSVYEPYKRNCISYPEDRLCADLLWEPQQPWEEELAQHKSLADVQGMTPIIAKAINTQLEEQRVYQFLMGSGPKFQGLCTQILNTTPLPSLGSVYAMVEESKRRHQLTLTVPPAFGSSSDQMAFTVSSRQRGHRSSGTPNVCAYCKATPMTVVGNYTLS